MWMPELEIVMLLLLTSMPHALSAPICKFVNGPLEIIWRATCGWDVEWVSLS